MSTSLARSLAERMEMAKRIEGLDGIEIVYPGDFVGM